MDSKSPIAKPETLSQIARDVGQVFFASMFIGPLIGGGLSAALVIWGLILSALFWYTSLLLAKE